MSVIKFIRTYIRLTAGLLIFLFGASVLLYKIFDGQLSKSLSFGIILYSTEAVVFLYIVWLLWSSKNQK